MFGDLNESARGTAWLVDCDGGSRPIAMRYVAPEIDDDMSGRLVLQNDGQTAHVEIRLVDMIDFCGQLLGVDILAMMTTLGPLLENLGGLGAILDADVDSDD